MGNNYSKAEKRQIVKDLYKYLHECEEGTDITTCQLLDAAGYKVDQFSEGDLMDINRELFKSAKANHIILDMSAHDGMVEGLPYNLDFIVRHE